MLLSDLVLTIRQRCNKEQSQFVTDAELASYVNSSLGEQYDLMVETFQDYNRKMTLLTADTSSDGYAFLTLPTDFLSFRRLERNFGSGWYCLAAFRSFQDMPPVNLWSLYGPSVAYEIVASQILLEPFTNAAGSYRLHYIPTLATLALSDALPSFMQGNAWTEYAVVDSLIKVYSKEDMLENCAFLASQKDALRRRIMQAARHRDASGIDTLVDVRDGHWRPWRG